MILFILIIFLILCILVKFQNARIFLQETQFKHQEIDISQTIWSFYIFLLNLFSFSLLLLIHCFLFVLGQNWYLLTKTSSFKYGAKIVPIVQCTRNAKYRKQNKRRYVYIVWFPYIFGDLSWENIHYISSSYNKWTQALTLNSSDFTLLYLRSKHLPSKFSPWKLRTLNQVTHLIITKKHALLNQVPH